MPIARRLAFFVLLVLCSLGQVKADASEPESPQGRFEAFLAALDAAPDVRRAFVEHNFTQRAKDKLGVDGLAAMMARMSGDIHGAPPIKREDFADRVEAEFKIAGGDDRLMLTLHISAPPETLIDGFAAQMQPGGAPEKAVAAAEIPKAIAALVRARADKGFSGAVLVAKDGKPVFAHAYGLADRANKRTNTLDTPFNLASDSKMFTALVIARLVEQGKLDWNDKVGKFLPDWPVADVRENVTIAQLLSHTSGLGEYWGPEHDAQLASLDSVSRYAALIRADKPAAEPGKQFRYSNNGYVLLGLIAEKISGRNYYDLVREVVYKPAGMTHSDHYDPHEETSGRAIGYLADGKANTSTLAVRGSPAGGSYASANDLLRFAAALTSGKIVAIATLAKMTEAHAQMGGPQAGYGFGFGVFNDREKHYGHNGGSPGVQASFEIFPDSGYVVIVLSNMEGDANELAMTIGRMILSRS